MSNVENIVLDVLHDCELTFVRRIVLRY